MQAIILAAGMGKRLGELTKNNTKCMVEVNGIRLIDRMITQLSKFNLNRLVIVVGYEGKKLIDYIGHRYDDILKIEYINNPIYDRTNNIYSLALAKEELCKDDTILLESDLIFEDRMLELLINHRDPDLALVAKYETWMDGTMVCVDNDRNITNFVPKEAFCYENADVYYKTVNIYKFSSEFSKYQYVPFLEAYCRVMGNNEYYEQVLRILLHLHSSTLKALPITNEKWYEIDDVQDLDIAETLFAEEGLSLYQKRYGGYWRFPTLLDFCYLVNPYFPPQRMVEEMKSNFATLLTEYPSGMSVNNLLISKYFNLNRDYVCVGNGAAELIKVLMEFLEGNLGVIYPTFEEYPNRYPNQHIISYVPDNTAFSYSVSDLQNYFSDKSLSALLLINPDNPSGNFISRDDVLKLADWAGHKGITLIVDESFVDFAEGGLDSSLLLDSILDSYPHLIVLKSISKSYGVPGLRLGILASSNRQVIDRIRKEVSIWNINSFAEFYMQIYGKYESDYRKACERFQSERTRFYKELSSISFLRVIPSQANYFLCEVIAKYSSTALTRLLLYSSNILIKDCSTKQAFNNGNYIRIAIRNEADNNKLLSRLKELDC